MSAQMKPTGDVLIRDGVIITMDEQRSVVRGNVLIRDGVILHVGPGGDTRELPAASRVIDARGCAVMPGLVQAHVHLCQTLFRGAADDLSLMRWLRERIWPLEAAHNDRSLFASARLGLAEMMLAGTTTVLDMGTVHEQDAVFEAMLASGIRGYSGKAMMDQGDDVPAGLLETTRDSMAKSLELVKRWHGAAGGRLGYAFAPRFALSCTPKLLREVAAAAVDKGCLIHSHAAEQLEERSAVRAKTGMDDVEFLAEHGICGPNTVLAHGVHLSTSEMMRAAARGTRFVHCPTSNLKLASGIADVVAMKSAGLVVALGCDGAACNNRLDPWSELRQAALLAKVKSNNPAALRPSDVLAMATIDGAEALGMDALIGSLEPGKLGDAIVVRLDNLHEIPAGDPMSRLVYSATANDVTHVMIDGRVVVDNSELRTMDVGRVRDDARKEAQRLAERM